MSDKMREAFETAIVQVAEKRQYRYMDSVLERDTLGDYATTWVDSAWIGYQIALTQQPEIEPDVWLFPDRVWSELSSVEIGRNGMGAFLCPHLSAQVPDWQSEAKRAFWAGLEIGAGMGAVSIQPRWDEYINKRLGDLAAAPSIAEKPKEYSGVVCRGSWALGSACGKCQRCEDTRP